MPSEISHAFFQTAFSIDGIQFPQKKGQVLHLPFY
jgi:hypothetical protein